jgi:hypothetical protein
MEHSAAEKPEKRDCEQERIAWRVRLPGFITDEIGLGDVIKRLTYAAGVKTCGGCEERAAALNRWIMFSR